MNRATTHFPWLSDVTEISRRLGPGLSGALAEWPLPPLYRVRQHFPRPLEPDVTAAVAREFARPEIRARIVPGSRICIAVGSRGISHLREIVAATVAGVRGAGGEPFIIPAMGSHGGATSEGQREVLAEYGITETAMGCPVVSNIEVREIGIVQGDTPVFCSVDAAAADGIIPVARVKPHTGFRGPIESGLMKMLTIGLGKQRGADTLHARGMDRFATLIPEAARMIMTTQPILFGLAIVENGYDEPARIEAVPTEQLEEREKELLVEARSLMPSIPFRKVDALVIQMIGKNISGSGLDPNVAARFVRSNGPAYTDDRVIQHVAVLDLTPETHGNASGIGLAELMTLRVLQKLDLKSTYANCLTASHLAGAMLPAIMESDRACIAAALRVAVDVTPESQKLVLIRSTLDVGEIWISPALVEEARAQAHLEVSAAPAPMEFDEDGNLIAPLTCVEK